MSQLKCPSFFSKTLIFFLKIILRFFYKVQISGIENIPPTGGILLLGNHISLIDWAIIQMACPRIVHFVMARSIYEQWTLKLFLKFFPIIPISARGGAKALLSVNKVLQEGGVVALFPEGYISRNGQIGKFHKGFETAIKATNAQIVPFYIRGLWGSATSYVEQHFQLAEKVSNRRVSIDFGSTLPNTANAGVVKQSIMELSILSWKRHSQALGSLQEAWSRKAKKLGNKMCVVDSTGVDLTYHQLMAAVFYCSKKIKNDTLEQKHIGIMLPPSCAGAIANLSVLCLGKVIVNLNYTAGLESLLWSAQKATIKTVITSRKFIQALAKKGYLLDSFLNQVKPIYLEDYTSFFSKLLIAGHLIKVKVLPYIILKKLFLVPRGSEETAVILFSSGSEGSPKGVELSHRNVLGNIKQVSNILNLERRDRMMSHLPLFHAFGLTVNLLLPLIEGLYFVCHADPSDGTMIGRLIYRHKTTLLFATSTLLGMYCRNKNIHPLLFHSLRLVIAGAEKLAPDIQKVFTNKFAIRIYEGYGTTEVSPVASCNLPDIVNADDYYIHQSHKEGTVGLPLPGTAFRVVDPESLRPCAPFEDGLIMIGGTQVMKGYLDDPVRTQQALLMDGDIAWYKTGDKGHLDDDGFLTIIDRYLRFAKIGGEMISLSAVENKIRDAIKDVDTQIMIISMPDAKRGECLVLLHSDNISSQALKEIILGSDLPNHMKPSEMISLHDLPKFANGKADYVIAKKIALNFLEASL